MRYYGVSNFNYITVLRYEGPTNAFIYSLPMAQSNNTYRTRADVTYLCNESGSITVTECQTNPDLVGTTLQAGNAYVPEIMFGNNTVRLESGNDKPVLTVVLCDRKQNKFIVNVNTVNVSNSFTVPTNNYAVIVEGTFTISNSTFDSNSDIHVIGSSSENREVVGEGKLVTFEVVDG